MVKDKVLVFIHGLEGNSQGFKARYLRKLFVDIIIPDFLGSLEERMNSLSSILTDKSNLIIIGSSYGGLMGTLFASQYPQRVRKLVLLAPALTRFDFSNTSPIANSTVIYHGLRDNIIPLEPVHALAEKLFLNLTFHVVDDNHGLRRTVEEIDWPTLLND